MKVLRFHRRALPALGHYRTFVADNDSSVHIPLTPNRGRCRPIPLDTAVRSVIH